MVNICGKCKHFMKTETTNDGYFYHYCAKADELYGNEPTSETAEGDEIFDAPTLKVKFNDPICELYEKK